MGRVGHRMNEILHDPRIEVACREFGVRFLHVFGSCAGTESRPESDVDLVVDFYRNGYSGAFEQFMGFKERLEEILERPVDLLVDRPFRNRVFREEVERTKRLVYAA